MGEEGVEGWRWRVDGGWWMLTARRVGKVLDTQQGARALAVAVVSAEARLVHNASYTQVPQLAPCVARVVL